MNIFLHISKDVILKNKTKRNKQQPPPNEPFSFNQIEEKYLNDLSDL